MKRNLLISSMLLSLFITAISCKTETGNKTEAGAAETATSASAEAVEFKAIPAESKIEWKAYKATGSHFGTVELESGTISMADGKVESGTFLINMNTITSLDMEEGKMKDNLEAHLKGTAEGKEDDFFNVPQYPTAAFEVTGFDNSGAQPVITGNLTLKGIKKNITFPVSVEQNGDNLTLSSDTFILDRTEWGIKFRSNKFFEDLGDKLINDGFELKITLKATKA